MTPGRGRVAVTVVVAAVAVALTDRGADVAAGLRAVRDAREDLIAADRTLRGYDPAPHAGALLRFAYARAQVPREERNLRGTVAYVRAHRDEPPSYLRSRVVERVCETHVDGTIARVRFITRDRWVGRGPNPSPRFEWDLVLRHERGRWRIEREHGANLEIVDPGPC